ncbi:MAG: hypothetical protein Kow0062_04160 [Acidobacteriota bacterium]
MMARRTTERRVVVRLLLAAASAALVVPALAADDQREAFERVATLFEQRCTRCHSGERAEKGLRLERDQVYRSTVNVPARSDPRLRRVAPGDPEASLLWRIVQPGETGGYRGPRMPLAGHPLDARERETIRAWILSFDRSLWSPPAGEEPAHAGATPMRQPVFADSHLVNLPAPDPIGHGMLQYRILHRFRAAADDAGARGLYGLDSGAWISFGLALGFGDGFELGLRRTNFERDWELYGKGRLLARELGAPFSLAAQLSAIRLDGDASAHRNRVTASLIAGRRFGRISAMVVPTWVSRANWLDPADGRGAIALGVGAELRLNEHLAVTGEWITQLDGVAAPFEGASLGFAVTTSKHVFHVMVTNVPGLHTDLWAVGGDQDFADGEFRLGFNISRLFDLTHGR